MHSTSGKQVVEQLAMGHRDLAHLSSHIVMNASRTCRARKSARMRRNCLAWPSRRAAVRVGVLRRCGSDVDSGCTAVLLPQVFAASFE